MKKLFILLVCNLIAITIGAEKVTPYKGSRIFWDTSTRTTVFPAGTYSRLIQLQDGRLMAVAENGGINIAFSRNKGSSWDSPIKIATNPAGINEAVPDLIQLSDGTIIVAYNPRPTSPYSVDRKFGIRCKRSTDNGVTWSNEIFVNDAYETFENGCWEPSMLELPSGELQLYFADEGPYTNSSEQQISLCRSFDKGQTWSAPQKISFRAGNRDGMPSPVLLKDKSQIVVAIEDNGWGYGDFFPTTVRCDLSNNWANNYFVNSTSTNRNKTLDLSVCPVVTGGAPYLRVLPNGETVLSWQSAYNSNGVVKMWVAMGDERAMNFKSISRPFSTGAKEATMWNSVAVVDTVVYAVGCTGFTVETERGYPKKQFEAAYGKPTIDGKYTRSEGYYTSNNAQFRLGSQTGTTSICDFAYDRDSLYFYCRVTDGEQIKSGAYQDGVKLYVDVANTSDTKPAVGTFQYFLRIANQITRYYGTSLAWRNLNTTGPRMAVTQASTYYIVEAAIPWSDMGIVGPPSDNIAIDVEVQNGNTTSMITETIPDAKGTSPWTWMPLHLQNYATGIANIQTNDSFDDITISVSGDKLNIKGSTAILKAIVYSIDGKVIADYNDLQNSFTTQTPYSGMAVISLKLENGKTITRKIVL